MDRFFGLESWKLQDLEQLVKLKMSRGKFRPGLLQRVQSNTSVDVIDSLPMEYSDCASILSAMKQLTTLNGVGPATASLVLACRSESVPFMSDELLHHLVDKPRYTTKEFKLVYDYCVQHRGSMSFRDFSLSFGRDVSEDGSDMPSAEPDHQEIQKRKAESAVSTRKRRK